MNVIIRDTTNLFFYVFQTELLEVRMLCKHFFCKTQHKLNKILDKSDNK